MVKQVKPLEYKEEDSGSGGNMPQPSSYETLKFRLHEDEKVIYELSGNIKQTELIGQNSSGKYKMKTTPVSISVKSGSLFFTNYRVIAQGKLKVSGGHKTSLLSSFTPTLLKRYAWTGNTTQAVKRKKSFGSSSVSGYEFPTKNHWGLSKNKFLNIVAYSVNIGKFKCMISVKPTINNSTKRKEHLNNIFDMLRKDADEVLDVIHEIFKTEILEKSRRRYSLAILKQLLKSEEFTHLSDSDKNKVIVETYKLDPEFFMASIYPKMKYWDFSSFMSIKEELFELLMKEGADVN